MTIEQKAIAYDKAFKWIRSLYPTMTRINKEDAEHFFPELKESEDEKIRKAIHIYLDWLDGHRDYQPKGEYTIKDMISWLENQGESKPQGKTALEAIKEEKVDNQTCVKPADKVEPKFKVGDWVVTTYGKVNQVIAVDEDGNGFTLDDDTYFSGSWKDIYHLWTIQDAKEGDVLANFYNKPFIYNGNYNSVSVGAYCGITCSNAFLVSVSKNWTGTNIHPATKEQHDLLFQKMKEAGYKWNAEKKELKKISNKIEIPFGSKDSELQESTYYIPKGFHAEIDDNKVVIKKGEKPITWSEEDENYRDALISLIKEIKNQSLKRLEDWNCYINWLKSLRPQKQWKPSEEQLRELENVFSPDTDSWDEDILRKLYEQLKQL